MNTKRNVARVLAALLTLAMLMCAVGCSKNGNTTTGGNADVSNTTGNNKQPGGNDNTTGGKVDNTVPGNEEPELYVVSGVWKFNEKLNFPHVTKEEREWGFSEELNFVTNGKTYDRWFCVSAWWYNDDLTCFKMEYIASSSHSFDCGYESYDTPAKWNAEGYKTVDFGENPQEVSQGFYEWLVQNAQKVAK